MFRVFFDLTYWSVRNQVRMRLRRLREPKYLVGAIVGLVWLGTVVFGSLLRKDRRGNHVETPFDWLLTHADAARFGVALALLALTVAVVWWPGRRRPLEFTPAEVQFLFQAPITRRQLLHYKLLRSQGGLLLSAAVVTLFLRPATLRDGWTFSVGFWLAFTVSRLFSMGVGLGAGDLRRRGPLIAVSLGVIAVLGLAAAPVAAQVAGAAGTLDRLEVLRHVWSSAAARAVLWPFVTLASLPLAGSPAAFWSALPGVLLLVIVSYAWVLRTDAAFEEGAAAAAGKPAAALVSTPTVARRAKPAPFPLALQGPPETAILWKNLILLGRYASLKMLLRILPIVVMVPLFPLLAGGGKGPGALTALLALSMTATSMIVVGGPLMMRNDLRQDLRRLALLKGWPVSGAAIVRGELLAPAIVLTLAAWLPIVVGALAVGSVPEKGRLATLLLSHLVPYAAAAMLAAPALILAQLVVHNGLAVLLPAWMASGRNRASGIEGMGQGILTLWGGLLATAVLLAPAAAVARLVMTALSALTHAPAFVIPAAVLLALVVAESLLVTRWLGRVLERSDLSAVDPVE